MRRKGADYLRIGYLNKEQKEKGTRARAGGRLSREDGGKVSQKGLVRGATILRTGEASRLNESRRKIRLTRSRLTAQEWSIGGRRSSMSVVRAEAADCASFV